MSRLYAAFNATWRAWPWVLAVSFLLGVGFVGYISVLQTRKNHEFVRVELLPLAHYVESFRDVQGRLPTEAEFAEWSGKTYENKRTEYYVQKPGFVSDWGTPGRDFVVGAWRGEWMHYYRSWDGKDFAGEMPPITHPPGPP